MTEQNMYNAMKKNDHVAIQALQATHAFSGLELHYDSKWHSLFEWAILLRSSAAVAVFLDGDIKDRVLPKKYPHYLSTVVQYGDTAILQLLVDNGFDPRWKDENGLSALGTAHRKGDPAVTAILNAVILKQDALGIYAAKEESAPPVPQWMMLDADTIAYTNRNDILGVKLTEIFNFSSCERLSIVQNLSTQHETHTRTFFSDMPALTQVRAAARELVARGGTIEPDMIEGTLTPKKAMLLSGPAADV